MTTHQSLLLKYEHIPVNYIANQSDLVACIRQLSQADQLAFDLEFDRDRHYYGFNLCLIQIATPSEIFVIDPISVPDLTSVFSVLENEALLKIVHCPTEDIRLLHLLGCFPKNMFDTEVCAKLLNYEQFSLGQLLKNFFDLDIDKTMQTSNWFNRPLTEKQLRYAANDVRYLFALHHYLSDQWKQSAVASYILEEQAWLNTERKEMPSKTDFLKHSDKKYLSEYHAFSLNELLKFRDEIAKYRNNPAHFVMPEKLLRQLALHEIHIEELLNQKGVPGYMKTEIWRRKWLKKWNDIQLAANQKDLSKNGPNRGWPFEVVKADLFARNELFQPIKQLIATQLGTHAIRHVLSTKTIDEILRKQLKITSIQPKYKQQLIINAAAALNIDLNPWL